MIKTQNENKFIIFFFNFTLKTFNFIRHLFFFYNNTIIIQFKFYQNDFALQSQIK